MPKEGLHLSLAVPEARFRPGDTPDFSYLNLPEPGDAARPSPTAAASETRALAHGLVRVLDKDGHATGPWNPELSDETLIRGLRIMLMTRVFDDHMFKAQRQGKTPFYLKCTGEEAIAAAQGMALEPADMCFPTYRQQGLLLARNWPVLDLMCQIYLNRNDRLKGRQLPVLHSVRDAGFFSLAGNLGNQFPQAVGWAMASAYSGDSRIAAAWIGEGASAEGDFHHAMVFAAVYHAPVILNLVNNQWAISSAQTVAGGEEASFASRAIGFGFPGIRVDGNDFLAVHAVTQWAAARARANLGSTLIEHFTYRAAAHSTSDDPGRYRPGWSAEGLFTHVCGLKTVIPSIPMTRRACSSAPSRMMTPCCFWSRNGSIPGPSMAITTGHSKAGAASPEARCRSTITEFPSARPTRCVPERI